MSEASPAPLSVKDRIALLKSTPSPPSVSSTTNSRPKSTNNIAEKLAALKVSSLSSSSSPSAVVSSSSDATSVPDSAIKTPSKDVRSKSILVLSDSSGTSSPCNIDTNKTPLTKDVKTGENFDSIADRIAALKTSTPAAAAATSSLTSPSAEVTKNANTSETTPATTAKRKGSIADRISALKNEPGGGMFSPIAESFSSASSDSVVNKPSSTDTPATEEQASAVKCTAKSNDAKRISARLNTIGFNPFGPRPTTTSTTTSAADAVTTTTDSEVKKSDHEEKPKEIVHLSMSRPTIAAGRRKGKNLPSKAAFSADTESLSASSTVTTSTTTATTTTTEGIAVVESAPKNK